MRDIFESGVTCHVFNRGSNKEDVFKEEKKYTFLLELMKKYLLPYTDIYAYCLMKNHYHLLLRFKKMRLSQKYADDADDTDSRR